MPHLMPLPLVPFEEYMLLDDRPSHPMHFFARFRFKGGLESALLEQALDITLKRHPLLTAIIERRGRGRHQWRKAQDAAAKIVFLNEEPTDLFPPLTNFDIRNETGFRLTVVQGESDTDLIFQFHHCCCDGIGALQVIGDLLVAYDSLRNNIDPGKALRAIDPHRLRHRSKFGISGWGWLRIAHKQAIGLGGVMQFIMNQPKALNEPPSDMEKKPIAEDYPSFCIHQFSRTETKALRKAAARLGVTRNELMARDLFLSFDKWRVRNSFGSREECLRLSIPMNLRRPADRSMPAANIISAIFLDRRGKDFEDPDKLLLGIHDEMNLIKRFQLGLTFVLSLWFMMKIPGGLRNATSASKCQASCLLTNLGILLPRLPLAKSEGKLIVGGVILERADLGAPFRPFQSISVALSNYAGRQKIDLHYDSRVLSPALADDLLDTYTQSLRASLGATS